MYMMCTSCNVILFSVQVSGVASQLATPKSLPSPTVPSADKLSTPVNTPPSGTSKILSKFVQKLLEMGFTSSSAEQAVEVVGEDMDKAVHLLTQGGLPDDDDDDGGKKSTSTTRQSNPV